MKVTYSQRFTHAIHKVDCSFDIKPDVMIILARVDLSGRGRGAESVPQLCVFALEFEEIAFDMQVLTSEGSEFK